MDFDASASMWMTLPSRPPAVTLNSNFKTLARSSGAANG